MTNAIVRQKLTQNDVEVIMAIAPVMKASRLFGVATDEQAAAVMIKGHELGFSFSASFEFIKPIPSGQKTIPTLIPKGMMALILSSGQLKNIEIKEEQDDKGAPYACTVMMERVGGFKHAVRFTMDDAKRAGLVKSGGAWESYPANMLRWRATGFCADVIFPDVIGGMKRADEFGAAVNEEGDVIDVQSFKVVEPTNSTPQITLNDLIAQYGPDAILMANGGRIPATQEEIDTLAAELAEEDSSDE